MPTSRARPELPELLRLLAKHRVNYVVTGSTAALLHGVDLIPGDLDVTPARDAPNLARLAVALESIDARPDPEGPFGDWRTGPDGEHRWVERYPLPGERERAGCTGDPILTIQARSTHYYSRTWERWMSFPRSAAVSRTWHNARKA